jgi:hypothetical protein
MDGPKRAFVAVRHDGRWGAARRLPNPPGADAFAPSVAVGADGTIAAAWQLLSLRGSEVRAALRAPGGPWRQMVVKRSSGPGVTVAPDGRVLVAWTQEDGRDGFGQAMLTSGDGRAGWRRPAGAGRVAVGVEPSVAALGNGALLAWVVSDEDDPESGRLMAVTVAEDGRAGSPTVVSSGAGLPITPALATDAEGRAVLVWSQRAGETRAVLTAAWRRADGTWSTPAAISDPAGYAFYPSVALHGDELRVVWIEIGAGETSVRAATVR